MSAKLFKTLLFLCAGIAIQGCDHPPAKVAAHPWIGYETLYLSQSIPENNSRNGFTIIPTQNATESMEKFISGEVDAAAITLDEAVLVWSKGKDLRIVLVFNMSAGGDAVVGKNESVKTAADLRGKTIGVEKSMTGTFMLEHMMAANGLTLSDVKIINLAPEEQLTAWDENRVDAIVSYEPTVGKLVRKNGTRIFDSRKIPNTIFDVLVVSNTLSEDRIEDIVKSHFKGLDSLQKNPDSALYKIAQHQSVSFDDVKRSLSGITIPDREGNIAYLTNSGLRKLVEQIIQNMISRGDVVERTGDGFAITDKHIPTSRELRK